ncbi:AcrR family transcriptional regulator [Paenibacillus endophyticus]|uniref:AcrR family transcriptional regulator n=1 Tax=Paenibacillus endophyticus TaxID=1294268 RepID=A0A7W5GDZ6_9BACL|nr:TetR/AcrR family transcriptional regulator [Paenibacillus endophyticus]MBB3155607.1 AcrR family transcriptional regulator [Paenibacillus endophyticus]
MFEKYSSAQKAVLESVLKLMSQKDIQATSMSIISKESGIPTGTIYNNFGSKEEIINELFKAIADSFTASVLEGFEADLPVQDRFFRVWNNLLRASIENLPAFQFLEQYSFSPYIKEETKQDVYEKNWCYNVGLMYQEEMEQDRFIESSPRLMVQMHYGMMVYLIKSRLYNQNELTEEIMQTAIQSCWNSLSKIKWKSKPAAKV